MFRWVSVEDRTPEAVRPYRCMIHNGHYDGPYRYPLFWDGDSWWTLRGEINMTNLVTEWKEEWEEAE